MPRRTCASAARGACGVARRYGDEVLRRIAIVIAREQRESEPEARVGRLLGVADVARGNHRTRLPLRRTARSPAFRGPASTRHPVQPLRRLAPARRWRALSPACRWRGAARRSAWAGATSALPPGRAPPCGGGVAASPSAGGVGQLLVHAGEFADHAPEARDLAVSFVQLALQGFVLPFSLAQSALQLLDAVLPLVGRAERGGRQRGLRCRGNGKEKPGRGDDRRVPGRSEQWRRSIRHGHYQLRALGAKFGRLRDRAAHDLRVCVPVHTPRFLVGARIERTLLAVGDRFDAGRRRCQATPDSRARRRRGGRREPSCIRACRARRSCRRPASARSDTGAAMRLGARAPGALPA